MGGKRAHDLDGRVNQVVQLRLDRLEDKMLDKWQKNGRDGRGLQHGVLCCGELLQSMQGANSTMHLGKKVLKKIWSKKYALMKLLT